MSLEALKAEIATKRKVEASVSDGRPTKYLRKGDLERLKAQQEQKEREEKERKKHAQQEKREETLLATVSLSFSRRLSVLIWSMENRHHVP